MEKKKVVYENEFKVIENILGVAQYLEKKEKDGLITSKKNVITSNAHFNINGTTVKFRATHFLENESCTFMIITKTSKKTSGGVRKKEISTVVTADEFEFALTLISGLIGEKIDGYTVYKKRHHLTVDNRDAVIDICSFINASNDKRFNHLESKYGNYKNIMKFFKKTANASIYTTMFHYAEFEMCGEDITTDDVIKLFRKELSGYFDLKKTSNKSINTIFSNFENTKSKEMDSIFQFNKAVHNNDKKTHATVAYVKNADKKLKNQESTMEECSNEHVIILMECITDRYDEEDNVGKKFYLDLESLVRYNRIAYGNFFGEDDFNSYEKSPCLYEISRFKCLNPEDAALLLKLTDPSVL